jgi:hypothetical protein
MGRSWTDNDRWPTAVRLCLRSNLSLLRHFQRIVDPDPAVSRSRSSASASIDVFCSSVSTNAGLQPTPLSLLRIASNQARSLEQPGAAPVITPVGFPIDQQRQTVLEAQAGHVDRGVKPPVNGGGRRGWRYLIRDPPLLTLNLALPLIEYPSNSRPGDSQPIANNFVD